MKKAAHRPALKGIKSRVNFVARIDVSTAAQIAEWKKLNVSQGLLLDRLTAHAVRTNFSPAMDCF